MRLLSVLFVATAVPTADATWSIIATDQNTGEVGVAATTCRVGNNDPATFKDDYWLEPENPDAGIQGLVAAAQAQAESCQSEFLAKYYVENPEGKEMTPELAVENYDKQGQPWSYDRNDAVRACDLGLGFGESDQLAVVDYCDSAVKTGANVDLDCPDGKGTYKGFTFSIQGNQLVKNDEMGTPFEDGGAAFIAAAKEGFTFKRDKDDDRGCDLAERLMQGLLEGKEIGRDEDCTQNGSTNIYYMSVIDKDGVQVLPNGPYFDDVGTNEDAVDKLHTRFQAERAGGEWCTKSKSSKSAYPCPKGKSGKSNASTKGGPKKSKGSKSSLLANVELQFLADDTSMSMSMSAPTFENGADIARE